jgi:hypothetical protein
MQLEESYFEVREKRKTNIGLCVCYFEQNIKTLKSEIDKRRRRSQRSANICNIYPI